MANRQRIDDETILAALLANVGNVEKSAKAVGISPRTIWQRMQIPDFRKRLHDYRVNNLHAAVMGLQAATQSAVQTAVFIMEDAETPPAVRLNAAKLILDDALKFDSTLTSTESREVREGILSQLIDGLRETLDEPEEDYSD